jgi:hypothetical protein
MSNTLVTSSLVAKESLAILANMLSFASFVNRDWEDEFTQNMKRGYAPGQTINIKKPPRYTYRAGKVAVPQGTVETTVPLTLSQGGCDLQFSSLERTLSLTKLEDKIRAAMEPVVNEIDRQGCELARLTTPNVIGTPGTLPTTQALALAAMTGLNQRLDEMGAPRDKRRGLVMNPALNASMIQGLAGLFNGQKQLSEQYANGMMVDSLGLMVGMDQNIGVQTNGTQAGGHGDGERRGPDRLQHHGQRNGRHDHARDQGDVHQRVCGQPAKPRQHRQPGTVHRHGGRGRGATSLPISPAIIPRALSRMLLSRQPTARRSPFSARPAAPTAPRWRSIRTPSRWRWCPCTRRRTARAWWTWRRNPTRVSPSR